MPWSFVRHQYEELEAVACLCKPISNKGNRLVLYECYAIVTLALYLVNHAILQGALIFFPETIDELELNRISFFQQEGWYLL